MKFLIVSPRQTSGGAIVLHLLCKLLMDRGHDAKIFYTALKRKYPISYATFLFDHICFLRHDIPRRLKAQLFPKAKFTKKPRYNGHAYFPVKGCQQKYLPTINDETIVIYPEIVYGNPLHAKKTIYWLLFFNPYKGDANAYAKDALIFTYHELFNDETLNPSGRKLYLQALDEDMWKQTNFGERSGCCYIVHKGHDRADLPKQFDGPVIDKLSPNMRLQKSSIRKNIAIATICTLPTVSSPPCAAASRSSCLKKEKHVPMHRKRRRRLRHCLGQYTRGD